MRRALLSRYGTESHRVKAPLNGQYLFSSPCPQHADHFQRLHPGDGAWVCEYDPADYPESLEPCPHLYVLLYSSEDCGQFGLGETVHEFLALYPGKI